MTQLDVTRPPGRVLVRLARPEISGLVRLRALVVCGVLAVLTTLAFCIEIAIGDFPIPLADVVGVITGTADSATEFIVTTLRQPRALVGLLAGIAFGVSGALLQAMTRNPLASPDIVGIAQGAGLVAVVGIVFGAHGIGVQTSAFLGAIGTALTIYLLAWQRGATGYRIVLVGIGVAALCTSLTNYVLLRADIYQAQEAFLWLVGNLAGRDWQHVTPLAIGVAVFLPLALAVRPWLLALAAGDDTARGLGVPVQVARFAVVIAAVGLVAVATAAAGPIAFVALIAPQIAVRLTRAPAPALVTSALVGSGVVLAADLAARTTLPETDLPVGVVTGLIGGPYLLWLLAQVNRRGSGG